MLNATQLFIFQRLYSNQIVLTDYVNVPTTVFTPLEYGFVGMSEEDAVARYGKDDIEVYHSSYQPLEYALTDRDNNKCYGKLVCVKSKGVRTHNELTLHVFLEALLDFFNCMLNLFVFHHVDIYFNVPSTSYLKCMHAGLLFFGQVAVGYKTGMYNRFPDTYLKT